MTVRTRFAPSPTGFLHIGGVRTALFNWLFARQSGGQFVLRIDDTDQQRNVQQALQPILNGFQWLGIDWDEGPSLDGTGSAGPHGPYFQSQRAEIYQSAVDRLLQANLAYRDYARPEEIQAEREVAQREQQPFVYSRSWAAESEEQAEEFAAAGRTSVVRLKMFREGVCEFEDAVRGDMRFEWNQEQDHVIQRADGSVLYHLASVVDDNEFKITHVIRAVEHLSNTPRQIFIARGLGYALPQFAHLPYVAEPGGTAKLSKRKLDKYLKNREFKQLFEHGDAVLQRLGRERDPETFNPVLVDFYQEVGYLPDAVLNYLLLLGWSLDDKTEVFSREAMIESFSLSRVNKSPASFDPQKLAAFQDREMREVPEKQKVALVLPYLQQAGWVSCPPPCSTADLLSRVLAAAGDRVKVAGDILDYPEFFVQDEALCYDEKAVDKRLRKPTEAVGLLSEFEAQLAEVDPFDVPTLDKLLHDFVAQREIKIGQVIHALRVAVTGKPVGLGMFETLEILGRDSCLSRLQRARQLL
ncbi:MAG: glutamate--tRNA ligase [Planctomycetota bacterium]|nr:glutamate--tRNA ligase [Planctomycetota bacterium]